MQARQRAIDDEARRNQESLDREVARLAEDKQKLDMKEKQSEARALQLPLSLLFSYTPGHQ